jgi:hypothetical protein
MNEFTQKGIEAFRTGDKKAAQDLFKQALQTHPEDETAWLWLAGTFDDPKARILCLQKALAINPENQAAQKGLAQLKNTAQPPAAPPESSPAEAVQAEEFWPDDAPEIPEDLPGGVFPAPEPEVQPPVEDQFASSSVSDIAEDHIPLPPTERKDRRPVPAAPDVPEQPVSRIRSLETTMIGKGKYAIRIPGFEAHEIVLKPSLFGKTRLYFDGERVAKDNNSNQYLLTSTEGLISKIDFRPGILDPLPRVWVDGEKLTLAPPLKWYQWAWMGIPLIALIVLGGAIGAFFGLLAVFLNIMIFRSRLPVILRYLATILVTLFTVVLYLIAAVNISALLQGY